MFRFQQCPGAELTPPRIIRAANIFALSAEQALSHEVVVPSVQFVQFQLERPIVVGTPGSAVLPKLLDNLMRLFD